MTKCEAENMLDSQTETRHGVAVEEEWKCNNIVELKEQSHLYCAPV